MDLFTYDRTMSIRLVVLNSAEKAALNSPRTDAKSVTSLQILNISLIDED